MAITIKGVPVLKKKAAASFNRNAASAEAKKGTIEFSKQIQISSKILAKAKI